MLALLDSRLHTRGYGYRFLESLPPAPVTHDLADVDRFFNGAGSGAEPGARPGLRPDAEP